MSLKRWKGPGCPPRAAGCRPSPTEDCSPVPALSPPRRARPWVRAAGGDKAHPRAGRRPGTAHCELQVAVLTLNRQLSVCAPRILKQRKRTEAPRVRLSCPPNPGCEHVHLGAPGCSRAEFGRSRTAPKFKRQGRERDTIYFPIRLLRPKLKCGSSLVTAHDSHQRP